MTDDTLSNERLRPHPDARFAPPQLKIDLNALVARLRSEPQAGEAGHRQETLYKEGGLTIALFLFGRFTGLPEHHASGTVNIHVLIGRLKITTEDHVHELQAGQMLLLAPGIKHAVAAEVESAMLLTIRLAEK